MRFTLFASSLLAINAVVGALKQPSFTKVFDGTLISEFVGTIDSGPFGQRAVAGYGGGNLTDPSTGAVVATFLSGIGAELGIFGANGVFYPDVRFVAQFVDDSALAYFNLRGVNTADPKTNTQLTSHNHVYLETSSSKYGHLSGKFLFLDIDVSVNPFILALYQLDTDD